MPSAELQKSNANYDATTLLDRVQQLFNRDDRLLGGVVIRSVLKPSPEAAVQHVMTQIDVLPKNDAQGDPELLD